MGCTYLSLKNRKKDSFVDQLILNFSRFGRDVKIVHFIGPIKPWHHTYNPRTGNVYTPSGTRGYVPHERTFLQLWWDIYATFVQPEMRVGGSFFPNAKMSLRAKGFHFQIFWVPSDKLLYGSSLSVHKVNVVCGMIALTLCLTPDNPKTIWGATRAIFCLHRWWDFSKMLHCQHVAKISCVVTLMLA